MGGYGKLRGGYQEAFGEEGDPRRHIGTQRDVKAGSSGSTIVKQGLKEFLGGYLSIVTARL